MEELLIKENFQEKKPKFEHFLKNVVNYFMITPAFNRDPLPLVHSLKYRVKDEEHLLKKIKRKIDEGKKIDCENIFENITDLAGVRILHLYPKQFRSIHEEIMKQVKEEEWILYEAPKAYTWDPESKVRYQELGIKCYVKPSYYTSVHYVIMPRKGSFIKCEIQVRTLFEEVWGEIDHTINYPSSTNSIACQEQLKVLAKLCSTGTRLSDSIMASHSEYEEILKK